MMANRSISIDVEPKVSGSTAKICAAALELYLNQHPELELKVVTLDDGTVMVKFNNRLVEDILEKAKRNKPEAPDPRQYDHTKCGGMGSQECQTCDMRCPYR